MSKNCSIIKLLQQLRLSLRICTIDTPLPTKFLSYPLRHKKILMFDPMPGFEPIICGFGTFLS